MIPLGFIYKTTCLTNGKIYIGRRVLTKDKRANATYLGSGVLFTKALNKYGKENFKRKILKICKDEHELQIWEYFYIKFYHSQNPKIGYNIADGDVNSKRGNPMNSEVVLNKVRGRKRTPEQCRRISESRKGYKMSEEHKQRISQTLKGRPHSEEHNRKVSEKMKGKQNWLGKHHSEETKEKLREINLGHYVSDETKEKIRNAHLGRKNSELHNKRISASNKGKHNHDQAWIDKIRKNNIGAKMITNGFRCKYLYPGEEMPIGWNFGCLKRRVAI